MPLQGAKRGGTSLVYSKPRARIQATLATVVLLVTGCVEAAVPNPPADSTPWAPQLVDPLSPEHHAARRELCDVGQTSSLANVAAELDDLTRGHGSETLSDRLRLVSGHLEALMLDQLGEPLRDNAAGWVNELITGIDDERSQRAAAAAGSEALRELELHLCQDAVTEAGALVFQTSSDHLQKPHRLTWFAEGRWWAILRKTRGEGEGWRVWRRDADGSWQFGADVLSRDADDRFDAFFNPDDGRVFALHLNRMQAAVQRLEYDAQLDMFVPAASGPAPTRQADVGTLTVDTVGRVWVAVHPAGQFAYTVLDAETLDVISPLTMLPDRVQPRSLVAGRFVDDNGPAVGFAYAQAEAPFPGTFRLHYDNDPVGTFATEEFAEFADDHTAFAAAGSDVVAVWKDTRDRQDEYLILVRRRHADGTWGESMPVFVAKTSISSGNHTRPRIVLDEDNRLVHVAAAEVTASAAEVHERVAPIDTLEFGRYRSIFRSGDAATGYVFRDIHAGQQPINSESGVLWLARGREVQDGQAGSFSLWENQLQAGMLRVGEDEPTN
jgi:hypothetical protein